MPDPKVSTIRMPDSMKSDLGAIARSSRHVGSRRDPRGARGIHRRSPQRERVQRTIGEVPGGGPRCP